MAISDLKREVGEPVGVGEADCSGEGSLSFLFPFDIMVVLLASLL